MIKRLFGRPDAMFALVFAWKALLLAFVGLPVPANDAFFYDGPVVNLLLNGKYCNPSLEEALPISGGQVFSAYPPLYQAALFGWMSAFGTSAGSAMTLHLCLFGAYILFLLGIFRRLNLPAWSCHVAALFLLSVTFHDRPDSLGHVFGIAAIYAWIRYALLADAPQGQGQFCAWFMAGCAILSLATGLQIGVLYLSVIWTATILSKFLLRTRFPTGAMVISVVVPMALVWAVVSGFPHLWAGFLEHARQTPSFTGFRLAAASELLKVGRTVPGILAIGALLPVCGLGRRESRPQTFLLVLTLTLVLPALAVTAAALFLLTPNAVMFAGYIQPLAVASFLVWVASSGKQLVVTPARSSIPSTSSPLPASRGFEPPRTYVWLFVALAVLGSVRAIGLTTWGVLCARDVGRSTAQARVGSEIEGCSTNANVVLSSAYLYEGFRHSNVRCIHSDWMAPAERGQPPRDLDALLRLKPAKLILTQFDYYRRYRQVLDELKTHPQLVQFSATNTAQLRAPDSFASLQKVVQHISWAPVIITFAWSSSG